VEQTSSLAVAHSGERGEHRSLSREAPFILDGGKVGMACFLVTEAVFFSTLIVTYLIYLDQSRPFAAKYLSLPLVIVSSICLISSSGTIHIAEGALRRGKEANFRLWWGIALALGAAFIVLTGVEWAELIGRHKQWMSSNLFGTTYFTLVGFHGAHVTVGLVMIGIILAASLRGRIPAAKHKAVELISWYWHFVDGVWIVVFTVVYIIGRMEN